MAIAPTSRPSDDATYGSSCTVVRVGGPVPLLRLAGELDRDSAPAVEAVLRSALSADRPSDLRVDVAGVRFVDVEGVRVLARVHRAAAARGAGVVLVGARPLLLEVAGMVAPDLLASVRLTTDAASS